MAESTGITSDVKNTILREQVLLVFRQLPTMQATSFIVALVLAYAVRNIVPATRLISFLDLPHHIPL
ncbi:MAG TPA: hypothetical protein VK435_11775 [Thermodesulfovibrionales bacterium]|nr:hypothetical protein [Thermodesulfovibrionales bacterium]